ncbi:MAG: alpha/beta hydrolase [Verrucomicrobiota bacterium]
MNGPINIPSSGKRRYGKLLMILGVVVLVIAGVIGSQLPAIGAGLILHPFRRPVLASPPLECRSVTLQGEGVTLHGWRGEAVGSRRGTLIYLHGVADNRASGAGVMERFRKRGFDVIAYDSRAHGESGGDACTFGFFEKEDLRRVLDTAGPGPVVLIGSSLGAAVALQLAAAEPRISAVVAAESFSDLRTVASDRAPFFFTSGMVERAFEIAEQNGRFQIGAASPLVAAKQIKAPVLLIHGAIDTDTRPDHARRIFAALAGPKHLMLVPDAGHNQSLQGNVWGGIERWIDSVLSP